jgi:dienelactone hydrolase
MWNRCCLRAAIFIVVLLALTACAPIQPPVASPTPETAPPAAPEAVEYDLGEAIVIQERFPADSRFREMPVRLNGVIATPATGGPYPVVLILHGTHPGCPETTHGVDTWPCDPAVEQPNYRGFAYLASELAEQGYVALSININAENTFGYGEGTPGERLEQIVELHLDALAEASAGGANGFGVELTGRADLNRLALVGHSRGGESAVALARDWDAATEPGSDPPVDGLLLIAPSPVFVDPAGGPPAPMAIVLPACDADVVNQEGQIFYEATRLVKRHPSATSVWLERANHNHFNSILPPDSFGLNGRPDCDSLLPAGEQRDFLASYAVDFLTTIFNPDPAQVRAAMARMGNAVFTPAQDELYGQAAQSALLMEDRHRLPLLTPAGAGDLTTSPIGAPVIAEGVTTFFCPAGYYTPTSNPELAACHRAQVVVPGQPAHAVIDWEAPGGALRFALIPGVDNLLLFDAVSVRAVLDPLSPLNPAGAPQAFSIRLTDRTGATASVAVRADEPALRYPAGEAQPDEIFGDLFSGRLPLLPVRVPLGLFAGVNFASIAEVAIVFDQTASGSLFLADVELVRSPISAQETLSNPPSPELIAAAEAGDVEAMRQLANLYKPTEVLGVQYGNLEQAVFWYRQACAAGYAVAQVDFYEFARTHAELHSDEFLDEAVVCLEDAIRQGHRAAIIMGAFHAAFIDQDYKTGFFRYALLEEVDPDLAAQRFSFADQLTQAEIDEAEQAAAEWRARYPIKEDQDFFAEVNSPFRQAP